jgi:hypothetical protein
MVAPPLRDALLTRHTRGAELDADSNQDQNGSSQSGGPPNRRVPSPSRPLPPIGHWRGAAARLTSELAVPSLTTRRSPVSAFDEVERPTRAARRPVIVVVSSRRMRPGTGGAEFPVDFSGLLRHSLRRSDTPQTEPTRPLRRSCLLHDPGRPFSLHRRLHPSARTDDTAPTLAVCQRQNHKI